jgi:hypothetical protein
LKFRYRHCDLFSVLKFDVCNKWLENWNISVRRDKDWVAQTSIKIKSQEQDIIKREIIHQLCIAPMSHSELGKGLPENVSTVLYLWMYIPISSQGPGWPDQGRNPGSTAREASMQTIRSLRWDWLIWFDFWCLMPLSAIFQLYHGDQF